GRRRRGGARGRRRARIAEQGAGGVDGGVVEVEREGHGLRSAGDGDESVADPLDGSAGVDVGGCAAADELAVEVDLVERTGGGAEVLVDLEHEPAAFGEVEGGHEGGLV